MILFSSFSHFYILLMFIYLGLLSGLIFFSVFFISNKLKQFNFNVSVKSLKKDKPKKSKVPVKRNLNFQQQNSPKKNNKKRKTKKPPNRETLKKINNLTKRFLNMLKIFFNKFKNIILCTLNIVALCIVVFFSYYVNFVFNLGHLRLIYVVIWLLSFSFSYTLLKKVAKLVLNFYNYLKDKTKNKRLKQNNVFGRGKFYAKQSKQ